PGRRVHRHVRVPVQCAELHGLGRARARYVDRRGGGVGPPGAGGDLPGLVGGGGPLGHLGAPPPPASDGGGALRPPAARGGGGSMLGAKYRQPIPRTNPESTRPPDIRSSIAISSATRSGLPRMPIALPSTMIRACSVRRASAAAMMFGEGIRPYALWWCSLT